MACCADDELEEKEVTMLEIVSVVTQKLPRIPLA